MAGTDGRVNRSDPTGATPLDDSATQHVIRTTAQPSRLTEPVNARGHITFGGRLAPDAKGFPASAMAKKRAGDWRDPQHAG